MHIKKTRLKLLSQMPRHRPINRQVLINESLLNISAKASLIYLCTFLFLNVLKPVIKKGSLTDQQTSVPEIIMFTDTSGRRKEKLDLFGTARILIHFAKCKLLTNVKSTLRKALPRRENCVLS